MKGKGKWLVVVAALGCLPTIAPAQTGRWVAYDPSELGAGTTVYDRGDACLGYTRDGSQYFLIFDAYLGEWQRLDLGQPQDFSYVQTRGDIVFGYSSSVLIAYSAVVQDWDTIAYSGTILYEHWQEPNRSYGCADDYAFMATDERVYVFEAAVGVWTEFAYTIPPDYLGGKFYPFDDFLFLQLNKSTSYSPPMNITYSLHTSSFNSLDSGCVLYAPFLKHGCAGTVALDGSADNFNLVGYSAYDNQFDVQTYSTGDNEGGIARGVSWDDELGDHTTYVVGWRRGESHVGHHCNYYGYDTRRGSWDHEYIFHDIDDEQYSGYLMTGGWFACDNGLYEDTDTYRLVFYSGLTGRYLQIDSDLIYKSTTARKRAGGTVFVLLDSLTAWTYDIVDEQVDDLGLRFAISSSLYAGGDFVSFCRWHPDSANMCMYFYNSRTNNWSTSDMTERHNSTGMGTPEIYMFCATDDNEILLYSSYRDEIVRRSYPSGNTPYFRIRDELAYARTAGQSYLFNTRTGQVVEFDFNIDQNGLGSHSGAFANLASRTLYGYSKLSGSTTSTTIADDPYFVNDTGYVGIVTAQTYNRVYAFNSFADSWVELIPVGYHVGLVVGGKTALVMRYSPEMLYAFDPEGIVVGIDEEPGTPILPETPVLYQNHPNPFNPGTEIEYAVPRSGVVRLEVFNLLGQRVHTLYNGRQTAGYHTVTWDASAHATGVYFYRLTAEDFVQTRKMVLLK